MISEVTNEAINFLNLTIGNVVDNKENIRIEHQKFNATTIIQIRVDPRDRGKVIGREGKTIDAMRTILQCFYGKSKENFILEMLEK